MPAKVLGLRSWIAERYQSSAIFNFLQRNYLLIFTHRKETTNRKSSFSWIRWRTL